MSDIPGFPFRSFNDLQAAVSEKKIDIGVNPLAAAHWSDTSSTPAVRVLVTSLSVLLVIAALSALIVAIFAHLYWVAAAVPAMAIAFYFSDPSSPYRKWVTIVGAASIAVFLDLLVSGLLGPALIVAYVGLTFAAVRAAGFAANSSFRRTILKDEESFVRAYCEGQCSVRDDATKRTYSLSPDR
ncbi:MAG TPA: hypothetical protein VI756_18435 [Blastocatellia bacterium]